MKTTNNSNWSNQNGKNNSQPDNEKSASSKYQSANGSSEETIYDAAPQEKKATSVSEPQTQKGKIQGSHIAAVAGAAGGVLIGGIAGAALFGMSAEAQTPGQDVVPDQSSDNSQEQTDSVDTPVWSDGGVDVAHGVTDDMSFSEAFAAARAEVGPGGAFEWHGNVYGTYYAEEWDSMSPDEQLAYEEHFSWSADQVSDDNVLADNVEQQPSDTVDPNDVELMADNTPVVTDDVEIISSTPADSEVEILGVVHDGETGMDFGGAMIDGQEVIFVDVDSDGTFDMAYSDINGDGEISDDEFVGISQDDISVSDFEQAAGMDDDSLFASNDGMPDYVNDADVNSLA